MPLGFCSQTQLWNDIIMCWIQSVFAECRLAERCTRMVLQNQGLNEILRYNSHVQSGWGYRFLLWMAIKGDFRRPWPAIRSHMRDGFGWFAQPFLCLSSVLLCPTWQLITIPSIGIAQLSISTVRQSLFTRLYSSDPCILRNDETHSSWNLDPHGSIHNSEMLLTGLHQSIGSGYPWRGGNLLNPWTA